jgi:hypothetical protein
MVDCHHSLYYHCADVITYYKNNGKLKGYKGPIWCRDLFFDLDSREGVEKALDGARKLIKQLGSYGLRGSCHVKFSGNRGFHVSFTSPALDLLSGLSNTPKCAALLAQKMSSGIATDMAIYSGATHLIRSQNTVNSKSGLYAIPLTIAEIFSLSADKIVDLARNPRRIITKKRVITNER